MADKVIIGNIRGKQGVIGNTPNISAEITGLPAGSTPTVERSGSNDNPIFTFGIPATDQGVVVTFFINQQGTTATTNANYGNIYQLLEENENVKFIAQKDSEIYLMRYVVDEDGHIGLFGGNFDSRVSFIWTSVGVMDFGYTKNPILGWYAVDVGIM